MINVLIVDDERLICEGLSLILGNYEDIRISGTCHNGHEAFQFCRENTPDVVLMDIRMAKCDGVEGTSMIKEAYPDVKVLILTTFMDDDYIQSALKNGAAGYILKDSSSDRIYEAIKNVHIGNFAMGPQIARRMLDSQEKRGAGEKVVEEYNLSKKDMALIDLLCKGLTNKEIAQRLFLTEGTVKNNVGRILSKLNLRDRTQIAIFAFRNKLV